MTLSFEYPQLSTYQRRRMIDRATQLLQAQQALIGQGGVHSFMLAHSGHLPAADGQQSGFISDIHYPKGDRIDFDGGSQYFYHCHRENVDTEEHGHFHCFIRKAGWPKSWSLARIPQRALYDDSPMTHLVAIGLSRYGVPIRLFMVNRWVSKESWFAADKMQRIVGRFSAAGITNDRPKTGNQAPEWALMDGWIEQMVHVFIPQIRWLYSQRDAAMLTHVASAAGTGNNPYLDESIEELASIDISLQQQMQWLTGAQ